MRELFDAILSLQTREEMEAFLRDLCTISELEAMAHRWRWPSCWSGAAVPGDRGADARVDDDRDARRALAAPRRGRLSLSARANQAELDLLTSPSRSRAGCASRRSAARGRRPRSRAAGGARARLPLPERPGRGAARARRRRPRVRAGRRRRLRHHRHGPRRASAARAWRSCCRSASARAGSKRRFPRSPATSGSPSSRASRSRPSIRV